MKTGECVSRPQAEAAQLQDRGKGRRDLCRRLSAPPSRRRNRSRCQAGRKPPSRRRRPRQPRLRPPRLRQARTARPRTTRRSSPPRSSARSPSGKLDTLTPQALQALMGALLQELRDAGRGGRGPAAARAAHDCQSDRSDGHGERAVARRQSGRVRARHVAELDRALETRSQQTKKTIGDEPMDLIADRGRRVTVDELNTTRLLAHARKQAVQRKFDDMLIVDVDAHHYENEHMSRDPPVHGERRAQAAHAWAAARPRRRSILPSQAGLPGHGRPRDALSDARLGEDRARPASRHPARRALDGRHERRLLLPVPDRHAQHRHASAEGNGGRAVLGLQPLAHREGAAGVRQPLLLDAVHAVLRSRTRRCAMSRPSATARASAASWSRPCATCRSTTTPT